MDKKKSQKWSSSLSICSEVALRSEKDQGWKIWSSACQSVMIVTEGSQQAQVLWESMAALLKGADPKEVQQQMVDQDRGQNLETGPKASLLILLMEA